MTLLKSISIILPQHIESSPQHYFLVIREYTKGDRCTYLLAQRPGTATDCRWCDEQAGCPTTCPLTLSSKKNFDRYMIETKGGEDYSLES
jgi:hypothetical protein